MKQLNTAELKKWMEEGKPFLLVDVREAWEREAFNIGGLHIPLGDLMGRKQEISTDTPVVLYCEKGIRSTIAIQRLEPLGFNELYNLEGGLSLFKRQS